MSPTLAHEEEFHDEVLEQEGRSGYADSAEAARNQPGRPTAKASAVAFVRSLVGTEQNTVRPQSEVRQRPFHGQPFVPDKLDEHEIDPSDPQQGELGDCWLMAAMAAVARANPEAIRRLIKDNGDGTYDVTLYLSNALGVKVPRTFRLDNYFPAKHRGKPEYAGIGDYDQGTELWPMLLEKAYAAHMGRYEGFAVGLTAGSTARGLEALLPTSTASYTPLLESRAMMTRRIELALEQHRPVVAGTIDGNMADDDVSNSGIQSWHAFAVIEIHADESGSGTIVLQDPTRHGTKQISIDEFRDFVGMYSIGAALGDASPAARAPGE